MRTVEHLIWQTLPWGIISLAHEEISTNVEKLPQDWTDEDKKSVYKKLTITQKILRHHSRINPKMITSTTGATSWLI